MVEEGWWLDKDWNVYCSLYLTEVQQTNNVYTNISTSNTGRVSHELVLNTAYMYQMLVESDTGGQSIHH